MSRLRRLAMFARFAVGLPAHLRRRVTLEESRAEVERRLANREESFLRWLARGVYGHPGSPYRPLLAQAGCELGDLEARVRSRGLEATLEELRDAGVYVSYEEFKGRQPIVRGALELEVRPGDFDNPFLAAGYSRTTGGTTGVATRVMTDLDNLREKALRKILIDEVEGLRGVPMGVWRGVLPDAGLGSMLSRVADGQVPLRWFTPVTRDQLAPSLEYRLATEYVLLMSRLCGIPIPRPEPVPLDEAGRVARWVAATLAEHGACHLRAYVSLLVRVARAALDEGLDLTGALFGGAGEPPTPAKVATIEATGARYLPSYAATEFSSIGLRCHAPVELNDLHVSLDRLALVQRRRRVPGSDVEVDAFLLTTLLASAPKLALNVESDDYGVVERRDCGCPWQRLGFPLHVRGIRSFRKLTSEGMTLVGSDVLHLLEEELPARFGGDPTDYQLVEQEEGEFTRLVLRIHPRLEIDSPDAVREALLAGLARASPAADMARATWTAAGTLRVERREPVWTGRGKLMPLHLADRRGGSPGVSG